MANSARLEMRSRRANGTISSGHCMAMRRRKSVGKAGDGRICLCAKQFELYFRLGRQVQVYSAPGRGSWAVTTPTTSTGYGLAAAVTLDLWPWHPHNTDGFMRVKSAGSTSWM